jgi:predicted AlkP superfamily phosphohydrolase/phosphomutase
MKNRKKVLVIGLDCASPDIIFGRLRDSLPNLRRLVENGTSTRMHSIYPPITVPAWMSLCSGKDAGEMGVYGFLLKDPHSYTGSSVVTSGAFSGVCKIWDILKNYGLKSILVGIPPSFPPYAVDGCMISDFLCPDDQRTYTFPPELGLEIKKNCGGYYFDIPFRIKERDTVREGIWRMTERRFHVIEYLMRNKVWDFFMFVEIGTDRIHHAFWKYYDEEHPFFEKGNRFQNVIPDYYRLIDEKIGRLIDCSGKDTTVYVVSDHGVKAMKGCFCINEWFIKRGYLALNHYPDRVLPMEQLDVNWDKTVAWGWGGYYGRIFINRKGREGRGIVEDYEYEALRTRITQELESEKTEAGRSWQTRVYRPEELYKELKGDVPDLMAYFDNLSYRSAGTVGHRSNFLRENDTGPDDAVHDWDGIYIKYDPLQQRKEVLNNFSILDFMPEVMRAYGME